MLEYRSPVQALPSRSSTQMSSPGEGDEVSTDQDVLGNQETLARIMAGSEDSSSEAASEELPTWTDAYAESDGGKCTRWGFAVAILEARRMSPADFDTESDFQIWARTEGIFTEQSMDLAHPVNRAATPVPGILINTRQSGQAPLGHGPRGRGMDGRRAELRLRTGSAPRARGTGPAR